MSIADGIDDAFEKVIETVELISDPPALRGTVVQYPVYPRDTTDDTGSPSGPGVNTTYWASAGRFEARVLSRVGNVLTLRNTNSSIYSTSGMYWDSTNLYKLPPGRDPNYSDDVWEFPDTGTYRAKIIAVDGVAFRQRTSEGLDPVVDAIRDNNPSNSMFPETDLIMTFDREWPDDTVLHLQIYRESSISEILDAAISWPGIAPYANPGSNVPANTFNMIVNALNPAMDTLVEGVTDALIDVGLTLMDFVTQFVWKDVIRDFLLAWLVKLIAYGLRLLIGAPSYLIGKYVLDYIIPALDAQNSRRAFNGVMQSVGISPLPSGEVGPDEIREWAVSAAVALDVFAEGPEAANFSPPILELFSLVSSFINVPYEGGTDGSNP